MIESRTLLVLGAGEGQLWVIRTAKEMCLTVIAVDANPEAAGRDEVDIFYNVSNRDPGGILASVRGHKIHGVISAGSENPYTVALVAEELGTSRINRTDCLGIECKRIWKGALAGQKYIPETIFSPTWDLLDNSPIAEWVLKPGRGSGSRGVVPCNSKEQFAAAKGIEIAEQRVYGTEVSAEMLRWGDVSMMVAFCDRNYDYSEGKFSELSISYPSKCAHMEAACARIMQDASRRFDLFNCTVKADFIISDRPYLVDFTCRLSGGPLAELMYKATGVNYFQEAIRIALGEEPKWENLVPKWCFSAEMDL